MWTALERFGAELLWHVGGAAAHAIRLRAATVRKPKAAVRGVGRGGVELTRRTRRLTQRCGWLPAQISAFMRALPAFLAPLEIGKNGPRTVFAGKPSRVPQPSLPASQERRYTLVTNEDTNTPGGPRVPTAKTTQTIRPGVRSAHHRRRRRHCRTIRAQSTVKEVRGSRAASRLGHARAESFGSRSSTASYARRRRGVWTAGCASRPRQCSTAERLVVVHAVEQTQVPCQFASMACPE